MPHALICRIVAVACLLLSPAARAEHLLVSNEKDNTITVIDGATLEVVKTVPVGARPRGIVLSKDGKSLYICTSDADHIEMLDLASLTVSRVLPSGPDPELFTLSPDGATLYVSNEDDNMVSVLDLAEGRITSEIPVGVEPEGMGISPDGKTLVNTSETTSMAHFIDTTTHQVVANVLVDSRPRVAKWTEDASQVWVSAEVGGSPVRSKLARRNSVRLSANGAGVMPAFSRRARINSSTGVRGHDVLFTLGGGKSLI